MKRVAINGFGRIGSALFSLIYNHPKIKLVAVNDLMSIENAAYLLKYDSVRGVFKGEIDFDTETSTMLVDNRKFKWLNEPNPEDLPWSDADIDIAVECTGRFSDYEKANAHIKAGARKVLVSGPISVDATSGIKGDTVLVGVNGDKARDLDITSNASCTTNAVGIPIAIIENEIGIEKALLNTVHAYTATQPSVDSLTRRSDLRAGRAAAVNIIPSSTGAAKATTKVIKSLDGKFDGLSLRVPVIAGSMVDITFVTKRNTTVEEINDTLTRYADRDIYKDLFGVTNEPLVSSDIIGLPYASLADLSLTRVVGGNLVKIMCWYDNEMGYTNTLVRHILNI